MMASEVRLPTSNEATMLNDRPQAKRARSVFECAEDSDSSTTGAYVDERQNNNWPCASCGCTNGWRKLSCKCGNAQQKCPVCELVFDRRGMSDHALDHTREDELLFKANNVNKVKKVVHCSVCNHEFKSMNGYEQHMPVHYSVPGLLCETCGEGFLRHQHAKKHAQSGCPGQLRQTIRDPVKKRKAKTMKRSKSQLISFNECDMNQHYSSDADTNIRECNNSDTSSDAHSSLDLHEVTDIESDEFDPDQLFAE